MRHILRSWSRLLKESFGTLPTTSSHRKWKTRHRKTHIGNHDFIYHYLKEPWSMSDKQINFISSEATLTPKHHKQKNPYQSYPQTDKSQYKQQTIPLPPRQTDKPQIMRNSSIQWTRLIIDSEINPHRTPTNPYSFPHDGISFVSVCPFMMTPPLAQTERKELYDRMKERRRRFIVRSFTWIRQVCHRTLGRQVQWMACLCRRFRRVRLEQRCSC